MLRTALVQGSQVFDRLATEWDALAGQGMTDTPFQLLAYQRAWWQHLAPPGAKLLTVVVRDDAGTLHGLAPFYLDQGTLHFNGCIEETDYLDLIARASQAEAVWEAVFDCLLSDGFPAWQGLDLCNVPAGSVTRTALPAIASRRGLSFASQVNEVCPVITLPSSFDAYLSQIDKKQRHEIRRKLRRAQGAGVTMSQITPADDLHQAVEAFLALLQQSTLDKQEWLNEGRRAVFHEVAQAALDAGILQLLFLNVDGQPAATLLNFDYKGRILVYNSGLDPENYAWLSAGVVLTALAIEKAIASGRQAFDFLRGSESYKYRFGAEDTTIYRLRLGRNGHSHTPPPTP